MTLFWQTSTSTSTRLTEAWVMKIVLLAETCVKSKTSCCWISFGFVPKLKCCLILMVRILRCSVQHIDMVVVPWVKCWKSIKLWPRLHNTDLVCPLILWYLKFPTNVEIGEYIGCQLVFHSHRSEVSRLCSWEWCKNMRNLLISEDINKQDHIIWPSFLDSRCY